jgi:Flp pilus assembly pilin Flp
MHYLRKIVGNAKGAAAIAYGLIAAMRGLGKG